MRRHAIAAIILSFFCAFATGCVASSTTGNGASAASSTKNFSIATGKAILIDVAKRKVTVKQGKKEMMFSVPETASITRNGTASPLKSIDPGVPLTVYFFRRRGDLIAVEIIQGEK